MELTRVRALARHFAPKRLALGPVLLLTLLGVLVTLGLGWDGDSLTLFGSSWPLARYAGGRTPAGAAMRFVNELYSHGWLVLMLLVLPTRLLFPLADSFSPSQVLWLRLLPCTGVELAIARTLVVLAVATVLGVASSGWALLTALYHDLDLVTLMANAAGLVAHVLAAGGLVLLAASSSSLAPLGRRSLALLALLAPCLLYFASGNRWAGSQEWFPYAFPYLVVQDGSNALTHFVAASLLGLVLLTLYVALTAARTSGRSPREEP